MPLLPSVCAAGESVDFPQAQPSVSREPASHVLARIVIAASDSSRLSTPGSPVVPPRVVRILINPHHGVQRHRWPPEVLVLSSRKVFSRRCGRHEEVAPGPIRRAVVVRTTRCFAPHPPRVGNPDLSAWVPFIGEPDVSSTCSRSLSATVSRASLEGVDDLLLRRRRVFEPFRYGQGRRSPGCRVTMIRARVGNVAATLERAGAPPAQRRSHPGGRTRPPPRGWARPGQL